MFGSRLHWIGLSVLLAGGAAAFTHAEDESDSTTPGFREVTEQQDAAIEKAVAWLAKNQNRDGSWVATGGEAYNCAMTGLAGLALLAHGNTPGRGKYGENVLRAVRYLLKQQDKTGHISTPNDGRSMYGHGFAMTFLAECYGMEPGGEEASRIKECLNKAVQLTARAQSSLGGWYYSPNSGTDEGSVTITQVQALRACRNVGIDVPAKVIDRAIDYIKKSQQPDGGIAYRVGMTGSRPAISAAGAELLLMAGLYEAKETKRIVDYVRKNVTSQNSQGSHDSYTTFYAAQALHQIGGEDWAKYFHARRQRYLREQRPDGSWTITGWGSSPVMDTAMAVVVLALPYQYLPIYQK
ncbi:MAG: terpene cyclase/mutase family protein [Planctomycetota bacterium]|nr:terpene cyclase/mutase family protein [Planctomycetota bacterium]